MCLIYGLDKLCLGFVVGATRRTFSTLADSYDGQQSIAAEQQSSSARGDVTQRKHEESKRELDIRVEIT
jgi:hypothetical protein